MHTDSISAAFPIGTIIPYAGMVDGDNRTSLMQSGWLLCDGSQVSRTQYKRLYDVIGDIHGRGDAVDKFNLPDYQGRFLRGVSNGTGRDPDAAARSPANQGGLAGDNVGSIQADDLKTHNHSVIQMIYNNNIDGVDSATKHSDEHHNEPTQTGSSGGKETRPVNANVHWLILAGPSI